MKLHNVRLGCRLIREGSGLMITGCRLRKGKLALYAFIGVCVIFICLPLAFYWDLKGVKFRE